MYYVIYRMKEDGTKDYLYKTRNNVYIYHNTPNIYFGSYEEAYNFLYHNILNIPDFKTTKLGVEEMPDKITINTTIFDTDKSTLNKMCYRNKSVVETITFPPIKKNTIQTIDKKDIPVTIAKNPFDDISTKRDILTNIIKPFILEPGEEWHNPVDDMTDEQVNCFIDTLAKSFVKMKSFKKEELQEISEQWKHKEKVLDELYDYILERLKDVPNTCPETREDITCTLLTGDDNNGDGDKS